MSEIIPKQPRSYSNWMGDENKVKWQKERDAEKEFEKRFGQILDTLAPGWSEFICLKFTDDYFVVKTGSGRWRTETLARFKRNKSFSLDKTRAKKIREYVENQIRIKQMENESKARENLLKDLLEPIFSKYESDFFMLQLYTNFEIRIYRMEKRERYSLEKAYISIHSGGTVSKARAKSSESVYTIAEAEQFIAEHKPLFDELTALAEKVKAELPTEFFDKE